MRDKDPAKQPARFRRSINEGFTCAHCGREVAPLAGGSCRNHCPFCLYSVHVDEIPGDREAACGGLMECIRVEQDARRGWMLVHRCVKCGAENRNKAALNDPEQPDDFDLMLDISRKAAEGS